MPKTYNTPGVYVEEKATLPASVVQVPTAIPAFIGMTEKSPPGDKRFHRVGSLVDYEDAFGGAVAGGCLYTSMKLFYANGGGDAYVYSLGNDQNVLTKENFKEGLKALEKEAEPTLILFPDAVNSKANLKEVQTTALAHCEKFRNRFCILDVPSRTAMLATPNPGEFRNDLGINNLQYGAAYGPWLQLSAVGTTATIKKGASAKAVAAKTDATEAAGKADAESKKTPTEPAEEDLPKPADLPARLEAAKAAASTAKIVATKASHAKEDASDVNGIADKARVAADGKRNQAASTLENSSGSNFAADSDKLATAKRELEAASEAATAASAASLAAEAAFQAAEAAFRAAEAASTAAEAAAKKPTENAKIKQAVTTKATADVVRMEAEKAIDAAEEARLESAQLLKPTEPTEVPASGAIAGIYAAVDAQRGVWKAPANVSLNGIVGLTETINDHDQESLNVVADGKSINAIRAFPGKGILVWGARTLAGNDNEWRYVNVRRLFIMAEESIRRSTAFVVFEPNDENTWIKVKAMIESYLSGLWRQGALAGSKPEQAFFVNVGLGSTMTPQDILEGRMIINVGMAAVRPSEFVIIRFSHKLQEA